MSKHISIIVLIISATVVAISLAGCSFGEARKTEQGECVASKSIEEVLKEKTDEWMAILGVEGTAIGLFRGKPCIQIFTSVKTDEVRAKIPSTVENYPVIIEQTGQFRALHRQQNIE